MVIKQSKVPYELALNMTGIGRFNISMFLFSSGIIAAMVFEIYSVSYVVPASACELDTTSAEQGLAAGLPLIGVIATSHLWGYLADTLGRQKMLVFSMAIGFIAGALATLSPNWMVLCALKFMSSAAVSGASALTITLLGETTPVKLRSTLLMLTTSAFLTCTGIMAVLAIPVLPLDFAYYIPVLDIHFNSWRLLNLIFTIPCLMTGIRALYACESPKYLLSVGEDKKALEVLKYMFEVNSGKSSDLYQVESIVIDEDNGRVAGKGIWAIIVSQTAPLFRPPLLKGTLLMALLFSMVFICVNAFVVWFPFLADAFMSSVTQGATGLTICEMIRLSKNVTASNVDLPQDCSMNDKAMYMVFGIGLILAILNFVAGMMINLVGKRRLFIGIQMVAGTAALCINASSLWILSAVLLLMLLADIINFGFLSSFAVDIFPTYVKAKAMCLMLMMGRGSTILGINVLKELIEHNCEAAFYTFGVITIIAGLVGFLLPADRSLFAKRHDNTTETQVEK